MMDLLQRALGEVYQAFQPLREAIGTPEEQRVLEAVYRQLYPVNFSRAILERLPFEYRQALLVLPVRGVTWSDWGSAERLSLEVKKITRGAPLDPPHEFLKPGASRGVDPKND